VLISFSFFFKINIYHLGTFNYATDQKPVVTFKKYGIGVKFVTEDKPEAFAAAIDDKTKAIYVESIGNPKYNVSPLPELAKVSRSRLARLSCLYQYISTPTGCA
jgi:O-acetylhomoserine/O-acetylserine sulfhydrylase-like pyridoxal-dependent enzyme